MCGIAGVVTRGRSSESSAILSRMQAALRHRGPDGDGQFMAPEGGLVMTRLSIIDRVGGWQPLYNEAGSIALVANGEIYNAPELRARLAEQGHRFSTGSDCETIIHLYEQVGDQCVDHLRGMFAFALWDQARRRVLLARDRLGEKPLYFALDDERIIFASEMKSLLRSAAVPMDIDPSAVDRYFHYQFVPEPATCFRHVRKLPSGHTLTVNIDNWDIEERRYWAMSDAPPLDGDAVSQVRNALHEAAAITIRSDTPVGVALSGGFDSSAIAALAAKNNANDLSAFAVGYPGNPYNDERSDARAFADFLKIPFYDVELEASEVVSHFPQLVFQRDDPIADIAGHGYYALSRLAHEHGVPVLLQGQGGDELFWGYSWVRQAAVESRLKARILKSPALNWPRYISVNMPVRSRAGAAAWVRDLAGLRTRAQRLASDLRSPRRRLVFYDLAPDYLSAASRMNSLYQPHFRESALQSSPAEVFEDLRGWDNTDVAITDRICSTFLLENGIAQGDRLAMANGVELRLPLIDYRVVETVIGLRKRYTDLFLPPKHWFKAAMSDIVPAFVRDRPKRGFSPPAGEWIKGLFEKYGEDVKDGWLREHVLSDEGAELLGAGIAFPGEITSLSFKALVLEQWFRKMTAAGDS